MTLTSGLLNNDLQTLLSLTTFIACACDIKYNGRLPIASGPSETQRTYNKYLIFITTACPFQRYHLPSRFCPVTYAVSVQCFAQLRKCFPLTNKKLLITWWVITSVHTYQNIRWPILPYSQLVVRVNCYKSAYLAIMNIILELVGNGIPADGKMCFTISSESKGKKCFCYCKI